MIEVHNLTFGYSSTEDGQILKGVDFAAKTGKLTALIGTNGAGKSTLLKTIMGILKGKGEISVNGKPVSQYSTKDFSSTVSYLSQDNDCKVNLSVFEVVMLGRMGSMSFRVSDYPHHLRGYCSHTRGIGTVEFTVLCIAQHHGAQRWSTPTCVHGASPCKRT